MLQGPVIELQKQKYFVLEKFARFRKKIIIKKDGTRSSAQCFHCKIKVIKSNKLKSILKCQFCHAISKDICLNVFGSCSNYQEHIFVVAYGG